MSQPIEVPFHRPSIGEEEIEEVVRTLRSGWLTTGPRCAEFEKAFAHYIHAPHALALNSGTAALHVALAALKIGPGDEVITTPLTFCATVNVILHERATPVLADVGVDGNIDPDSIATKITEKTRAIIPVHLGGLPCEMDSIRALARKHGIAIVEDAAHAAGSAYRGIPIGGGEARSGTASTAVAFSFYATKNLTTGEGGMVSTHDPELADAMKILTLHGINKDGWKRYSDRGNWYYEVLVSGFKYNLSDIQAAVGIHQLRKLDEFNRTRRRYASIYNAIFEDAEEFELPPDRKDCVHAWHLYSLRLNLERLAISRDEFIAALKDRGIGASVHFIPIPLHPYFAPFAGLKHNECPRALALYPRLVSLPLYPAMTEGQVEYVAQTVRKLARENRKQKPLLMMWRG